MNTSFLSSLISRHLPLLLIIGTTLIALSVSIISLLSGWLTIFQNLFYIPIILACIYYTTRGFLYSLILSGGYFFLILMVSQDPVVLEGALIRVVIFVLVAGVITFISQRRKEVEEELRESEARYSSLFDNNYSVSVLIDPDTGRIVEANDAACQYYGFSHEEILTKAISDLNHLPRDKVIQDLQRAKHEGRKHFYSTHFLAGGEKRNVEIYSGPIRIQGKPLFYSIIHDITERKRAEQELIFKSTLLETQQATSIDGILVVDAKGTILTYNTYFMDMWGISRHIIDSRSDQLAIQAVLDTVADPEGFLTRVQYLYDHPDEKSMEEIRLKDGRVFDRYSAPMIGPDHTYYGRVWYFRDITRRKRAEEAMKMANKKLNLLGSSTRHDISNQLMVVNGYLELLHHEISDPALDDYFTKIARASDRITATIQFSKTYEQIGIRAPVWQVVRTILDDAAHGIPWGPVSLVNDLPHDTFVFADPMLFTIFTNLLDNAVRHGGTITKVRFSSEEREGTMIIVCEDDGNGIPEDEKEKIFERGYGKNSGLGLFLAREILAITEITIKENGIPGKGARFEIDVPNGMYRFSTGV